jgi:hypothetical protein
MPGLVPGTTSLLGKNDVDGRDEARPRRNKESGQIALAAEPSTFLRFHLCHFEQADEHAKPVPPRQPGEGSGGLGDEGRGLIRPAISRLFVGLRPPLLVRGCGRPATLYLGQKNIQGRVLLRGTLFESATLGRISQLFGR